MPYTHNPEIGKKFHNLVEIMAKLRGEHGCPWDKEQTHESLRQYLLEEAYEVLEAIDDGSAPALQEELGDLLLQIVFHAQIAAENEDFDIASVLETISDKLIRRHPNVFGDLEIHSAHEQSINWEKLKKQEGKKSVIDGVPAALSALLKAWRIQQKASTVGFDWPDHRPVWDKIQEELQEFQKAFQSEKPENIEEEFGDLLFSLVNLSRFLNVNPEDALRKTTDKFIRRFKSIELQFQTENREMHEASLEELDERWEQIKSMEKENH
ncbi:MAG: nucleoside triphosphate pyrophosphohydrolase [bacterium]